jgi:hypothetical protein
MTLPNRVMYDAFSFLETIRQNHHRATHTTNSGILFLPGSFFVYQSGIFSPV